MIPAHTTPPDDVGPEGAEMNDRELLTLAAKAAGIEIVEWQDRINPISVLRAYKGDRRILYPWSPLTADDDALRLAVKLKLSVGHDMDFPSGPIAWVRRTGEFGGKYEAAESHNGDPGAATRRAIVRAAAALAPALTEVLPNRGAAK